MIEAVPERVEGGHLQPRRRWSDAFKEKAVAEALVPGANVSAIARRIGVEPSQLFGWRRKARREGAISVLEQQPETAIEGGSSTIEIVIDNVIIRVDESVSEEHLQRVLRAVRAA